MHDSHPDVKLERVACPNGCVSDDAFMLVGHDRLHQIAGKFTLVRCNQCGLQRTNPRPTPESIGIYYPSDYEPYREQGRVTIVESKLKASLRRSLGLNTRRLPPVSPGLMLEVGCSSGNYMEQARELGWQVEGIEFSQDAAAIAKSKGFEVQVGRVETAPEPKEKYDIVAAWMLLEHLHEPIQALEKMRDWVSPNGHLVAPG